MTIASTDKTDKWIKTKIPTEAPSAVKNSFIFKRVISEQSDSSLFCKIQLAEKFLFVPFTTPQELARTVTRLTISKNSLKSFLNQKRQFYVGIKTVLMLTGKL